jgi:hypothetical protein
MSRHTFKLSTMSRAIRAAEKAGLPVDRVEVSSATGNVTVFTKPANVAVRDIATAKPVKHKTTSK